MSAFIL